MHPIVEGLFQGDRRSLARAISIVDDDEPDSHIILRQIFNKTGNAKTVGFTGAGGVGKSSLIEKLVPAFQDLGYKIAIIAVDPTSPSRRSAVTSAFLRPWRNFDRRVSVCPVVGRATCTVILPGSDIDLYCNLLQARKIDLFSAISPQ